jgi:coproporphyrinogen III oxidase-like Fe-S oxidoreductase
MRADRRPGFGVYVHVPFCLTRCHYCDFVTYTGMEGLRRPYAAALLAEAELATAALGPEAGQVVSSVFVGGGTPTLLPAGDLARMLDRLRGLLDVAPDAEVTVEANPETVDQAMADGLAAAGVTRVSMGAQSFDDRVLAALGRPHEAAQTGRAVAALRAAGIRALNLDLIFGCPHEDAASWAATLDAAIGLGPEHLSAYALTIEPATKFGRLVASGRMAGPDEDLLADRYETTCATLAGAGHRHYEVSNWARDDHPSDDHPSDDHPSDGHLGDDHPGGDHPGGGHRGPDRPGRLPTRASRHNLTYWRRGSYLGLGAGAHEFTGGVRRWNVAGVPGYLAAVAAGRRPTAGQERLSAAQAAFELLALRLRTADGLDPAEARQLGVDPDGTDVAELRAAGLLTAGPRVALTERGMFLHAGVLTHLTG